MGRFTLPLTSLLLACSLALPPGLLAQEGQAPADSTITLTKNVEVYSYEDLTFTVENYAVAPGDNIEGILKKQGLWPANDEAQALKLLRLVRELNPVIANLDQISAGQNLYLPRVRPPEPDFLPGIPQQEDDPSIVVTYELSSPDQSPARVVVMRQSQPGDAPPPGEELPEGTYPLRLDGPAPQGPPPGADAPKGPAAPAKGRGSRTAPQAQPPAGFEAPPRAEPAAYQEPAARPPRASRNEGPVDVASDGTAYRTVRIRRGDTLERLLRREGLDPRRIYTDYIRVTRNLNPGLRDPNMIIAGAELRIPVQEDGGPYYQAAASPPAQAGPYEAQGPVLSDAGGDLPGPGPVAQASPPRGRGARSRQAPPAAAPPGKFRIDTRRLPASSLPTADSVNARTTLSVIFTRLGEEISTKGRLFLPLDEPPHYDHDMSAIPVLELRNGRKVILDLQRTLPAAFIQRFREKYPAYMVFQPNPREPLAQALDRLWPLCGYYRVYDKGKPFEGGRDIKLKLAADWLIWPTAESWNKGQPVAINLAPAPDNGTPEPWVRFLRDHGIQVVDLYQGQLLAGTTKGASPINNFTVIEVQGDNPSAFAAALIKSFGLSPRIGVSVDLTKGRIATGGAGLGPGLTPAVFWEDGQAKNILEYGDLSTEELAALRQNGFNVISSAKDIRSVLRTILAAAGLKLGGPLVINGDSSGGPSVSLTIQGETFSYGDRVYLFTSVILPGNLTGLDPNQNAVILRYQPSTPAAPASPPPAAAPAAEGLPGALGDPAQPGDGPPDGAQGGVRSETIR